MRNKQLFHNFTKEPWGFSQAISHVLPDSGLQGSTKNVLAWEEDPVISVTSMGWKDGAEVSFS